MLGFSFFLFFFDFFATLYLFLLEHFHKEALSTEDMLLTVSLMLDNKSPKATLALVALKCIITCDKSAHLMFHKYSIV